MKKIILVCLSISILVSVICSCETGKAPKSDKMQVIASIYPIYDFSLKIAGDKADVKLLVPVSADPHDWEPKAADMISLEKCDVFIYNGVGMEHWVDNVLDSLDSKTIEILKATKDIPLILSNHDSDKQEHDPHVWLSPINAKLMLKNIYDTFAKADENNKEYYKANLDKYIAEMDKLDEEFKLATAKMTRKDIVVTHQAFGYLCDAYGLSQVAIEGINPEFEPSASRMTEIIKFVKKNNIKVIFFEELVSSKVANTIALETGARIDVLNPVGGITEEQADNGDDYFSIMRKNLQTLSKALN